MGVTVVAKLLLGLDLSLGLVMVEGLTVDGLVSWMLPNSGSDSI